MDLIKGQYRRVYSGYLRGRRLNSVSIEAEAAFFRLNVLADDYGNYHAAPDLIGTDLFPRRPDMVMKANDLLGELLSANLIRLYEHGGERYCHICGYVENQPTKNGKRVHKFPAYLPESPSGCKKPDNPKPDYDHNDPLGLCEEAEPDESSESKPIQVLTEPEPLTEPLTEPGPEQQNQPPPEKQDIQENEIREAADSIRARWPGIKMEKTRLMQELGHMLIRMDAADPQYLTDGLPEQPPDRLRWIVSRFNVWADHVSGWRRKIGLTRFLRDFMWCDPPPEDGQEEIDPDNFT